MNAPHDPSPELAALLRLKRHEQPPPGYYDEFAHAFRERQRAELLRVSVWRLLADRVGTHFQEWRGLMQPRWMVPAGAASLFAIALMMRPSAPSSTSATTSLSVASSPPATTGSVRSVAVAPGAQPSPRTARPPGEQLVSSDPLSDPLSDTLPASNGLRRTPGDALVPLHSSTTEEASSPANHGKVIILVR